jgi:DNA-binding NarL/FixJ family response regulator
VERSVAVAVVDGNSRAREGLVRRLRQASGISLVAEAGTLDEALRIIRDRRPDVVLLDPRRIGPGGGEVLGPVTAAAREARIVILTAYVNERERSELMQAGASMILVKEIDSARLVRTIRTVASGAAAGERRSGA